MDYSQSFAISAVGMAVERARVDVAALNLANAHTVQTPDGKAFQPLHVVARSVSASQVLPESFAARIAAGLGGEMPVQQAFSLPELSIEPDGVAPKPVYEPGNPFADSKGFVTYPGVDTATEMVNLMGALRAYEANVVAMNTAKTMALKTLEIGGGA